MKSILCLMVTICFTATLFGQDSHPLSILANPISPSSSLQDGFDSILDTPAPDRLVLEGPLLQESEIIPQQSQRVPAPILLAPGEVPIALPVPAAACQTCCKTKCRCKKVPQKATFCLVAPNGCEHEACAKVPACCAGEAPSVSWKRGILGRMVATLCWECCDHQVKVIVTRRGKVRVRD